MLCSYYISLGDDQKLLEMCQKALALDPDYGQALNMIAYAYVRLKDYDEAVRHLEKYISLNPREPNPYDSLADAYFLMGRLDEALANYSKAITLKPGSCPPTRRSLHSAPSERIIPKPWNGSIDTSGRFAEPAARIACHRWKAFYALWLGSEETCLVQIQKMTEIVAAQGMIPSELIGC